MDLKTKACIVGESIAKLYFEMNDFFVYTNSSGKAEFDLLLSKDGLVYTVEVKTVSVLKSSSKGEYFEVQLKSVRSNTTENTIHNFDNSFIDYLVVVDITSNKIALFKSDEVVAHSTMRVYADKFKNMEEQANW